MQYQTSLNELYAGYTAGWLKKEKIEAAIFKMIQENIHCVRHYNWSKEDCDDYISWLYLRIGRAIENYQENGSTFETYIGSMIRLAAKEYRLRQVRSYAEESAAWVTQIPEMYVHEKEPEYLEHITEEEKEPVKLKNPRQMLILILKCCNHVSADFLEMVSPHLGIAPETLQNMVNYLIERRQKRENEVTLLREKANRQLYHCILCEQDIQSMIEGSRTTQQLQEQLERRRSRLNKTRKRLAVKRLDPSNAQIANVLGISKGTVDSALYNLRKRWNREQTKQAALHS
ncbi:MAG: hypothetical protein FWD36_08125 [Treponema sp.]|nr:hypothetical protein [Treponema sp.]